MRKYIFLTPEEINNQAHSDCPMPDFLDLQGLILDRATSMQDALNDLIESQVNPEDDGLEFTLPFDLRNDSRRLFSLKEYREKVRTAS